MLGKVFAACAVLWDKRMPDVQARYRQEMLLISPLPWRAKVAYMPSPDDIGIRFEPFIYFGLLYESSACVAES
jgi:hypothetical protein